MSALPFDGSEIPRRGRNQSRNSETGSRSDDRPRRAVVRTAGSERAQALPIEQWKRPGNRGDVVDQQAAPGVAGLLDRTCIEGPVEVGDPYRAVVDRSRRRNPDRVERLAHSHPLAPPFDGVLEARDGVRFDDVHRSGPGTVLQEAKPDVGPSEVDGKRARHRTA